MTEADSSEEDLRGRSDAANGNGPSRLHAALDVRLQPGAQFQSGGRPLRRLLEPHQRQVSGLASVARTHTHPVGDVASRAVRFFFFIIPRSAEAPVFVRLLRSEGIMPAGGALRAHQAGSCVPSTDKSVRSSERMNRETRTLGKVGDLKLVRNKAAVCRCIAALEISLFQTVFLLFCFLPFLKFRRGFIYSSDSSVTRLRGESPP